MWTLTKSVDSILTGQIYRFRFRAFNVIDWGLYSTDLIAAVTSLPTQPSTPVRDNLLSTRTSIAIYWQTVADGAGLSGAEITGYRVYFAKDIGGTYSLLFDGKDFRTITSYIVEDLNTGSLYKFKISAYNFNGEGPVSNELVTYACVAPSKMSAPTRVSSTQTSINIEWEQPKDNGGCSIQGYAVFRNDGNDGQITTEVNTNMDTNIRDRPSLNSMSVTYFPPASVGSVFAFQVKVFNLVGSSLSFTSSYLLATIPSSPESGPVNDLTVVTSSNIRVSFSPLTTVAQTGGSTVLSYNLQVDDGAGNFTNVQGLQKDSLALSARINATKGVTYAFRYRAKNVYGWGDFSPLTFVLAADKPSQPQKPSFIAATDNSISV